MKTRNRKAFALVLAIGAMAFMVLLTLTLSSIISAKLRVINAQKQAREARSNAILGMSVAISELQRTLGRDNAVSFQASVFDEDPKTVKIDGVKVPYALGTIKIEKDNSSLEPLDLYQEQVGIVDAIKNGGEDPAVTWLISSERRLRNPIFEQMSDISGETVKLAEYKELVDYPVEFGGRVSATDKSDTVEVRAGKVPVAAASTGKGEGAYAYWISDESLKAKVSLIRPDKYLDEETGDAASAKAPADSRTPQIVNLSFVDELAGMRLNPFVDGYDEIAAKNMAKATVLGEVALVDNSLTQWAKDNLNDYTASSVGIPVDVTQGRLKEDLTAYLSYKVGLKDEDSIIRGSSSDEDYTGVNFGITDWETHLPRFGQLRDFYEFGAQDKTKFEDEFPVSPTQFQKGSNEIKHGLYPIIQGVQWVMLPAYRNVGTSTSPDTQSSLETNLQALFTDPKNGKVRVEVVLLMWPKIRIWNPNNVALEKTDYIFRLYMPFKFSAPDDNPLSFGFVDWRAYLEKDIRRPTLTAGRGYSTVFERMQTPPADSEFNGKYEEGYFHEFIKDKAGINNPVPVMNFRVNSLSMRPGEMLELIAKENTENKNEGNIYKDVELWAGNQLPNNVNLLQPDSLSVEGGSSSKNVQAQPGRYFVVRTGLYLESTRLVEMTSNMAENSDAEVTVVSPVNDADRQVPISEWLAQPDGTFTAEDPKDSKDTFYVYPESLVLTKQRGSNAVNLIRPQDLLLRFSSGGAMTHLQDGQSYAQEGWAIKRVRANKSGGSGVYYDRIGNEILKVNNGSMERLAVLDLNEFNSTTSLTPDNEKLRDEVHHYYRQGKGNLFNVWDEQYPTDGFSGRLAVLPYEGYVRDSDMGQQDLIQNVKAVFMFANRLRSNANAIAKDGFSFPVAYGYRYPDIYDFEYRIFNATNIRQNMTRSPSITEDPIRRNTSNYSIAFKWGGLMSNGYRDFFGGANAGVQNATSYTWRLGNLPNYENMKLTTDELMPNYQGSPSDGYSSRFGALSFLSGERTYDYNYMISALFDVPRTKFDIMSLGFFSHANLSPLHWQPSNAFAESFASPFLDRTEVFSKVSNDEYNKPLLYQNELVDISYMLNASMWDRFFLSTLSKGVTADFVAGMRLPNTRLFLTSTPEDKSELQGSEDSFKRAARYIAIDGPFNVNSASYEAWRAVLGGMLGTKKQALVGKMVNSETQRYDDPDNFFMPNPGDMNPLVAPDKRVSDGGRGEYITYLDTCVGRMISESEIDQLAREVVQEVKRRAPFFSLADFVNRRLAEYESGEDEDSLSIRFQGIMGTLSAAIQRAVWEEARPHTFFNDDYMDRYVDRKNNIGGEGGKINSFVKLANNISAYDKGEIRNNMVDLGEQVRKNEQEYLEHAITVPRVSKKTSNRAKHIPGMLSQADLLSMLGPTITVRGDTFVVRAYGESKNPFTQGVAKAYCEAVVQRVAEPVDPMDEYEAPLSEFGRKFKVVSFKWLTPSEL